MIVVLWAIFNIVCAIMAVFGNEGAGLVLAWSIILGWAFAIIVGIVKS